MILTLKEMGDRPKLAAYALRWSRRLYVLDSPHMPDRILRGRCSHTKPEHEQPGSIAWNARKELERRERMEAEP